MRLYLLLLALLAPLCSAEDVFFFPSGSPFMLVKAGTEGSLSTFEGTAIVGGVFRIGWEFRDPQSPELNAVLELDSNSSLQLPYEQGKSPTTEVLILHPEEAAKLIFGSALAADLAAKKIVAANVAVRVRISGLSTAVDCDNRWFMADIIAVLTPPGSVSLSYLAPVGAC